MTFDRARKELNTRYTQCPLSSAQKKPLANTRLIPNGLDQVNGNVLAITWRRLRSHVARTKTFLGHVAIISDLDCSS